MVRIRLHLLLLLTLVIASCGQPAQKLSSINVSSDSMWQYANLLNLDPTDQPTGEVDLIAVYFRNNGAECQVRLDFLDSSSGDPPMVYIAFDYQSGGQKTLPFWVGEIDEQGFLWDMLIGISGSDQISMVSAENSPELTRNINLRASRNISQDNLVISLDCRQVGIQQLKTKLEVFVFNAKSHQLNDDIERSEVVRLESPPPNPARILFYFYNTFSGKTPAQALKKWDGAHTGTASTRHGLRYLVDAVELNQIPVILADLKTPENLSALDYMGKIPQIRMLESSQLLILPDNSFLNQPQPPMVKIPEEIYSRAFEWSQKATEDFMLGRSPFFVAEIWPTSLPVPPGHLVAMPRIIEESKFVSVCLAGQVRVLCRSASPPLFSNAEPPLGGLLPAVRSELIRSAMRNSGEILLMGGDFAQSWMGDIGGAQNIFSYIRNHPWIQAVNANDLLTAKPRSNLKGLYVPLTKAGAAPENNSQKILDSIVKDLSSLPENDLSEFAWQAFFSLLRTNNPRLFLMNMRSLGQIGYLAAASRWYEQPSVKHECDDDLNWDGHADCILTTRKSFAAFDARGGALVAGFFIVDSKIQLFASSSFFIATGISDPSQWKPESGVYGDPDAPGAALVVPAYAGKEFYYQIREDNLIFTSEDNTLQQEFHLAEDSLLIRFLSTTPLPIQLQLVTNPWERFHPGWWTNPGKINYQSTFESRSSDFDSSLPFLSEPEDPNFDYGRGHYVLIPFRIISFDGAKEGWIEIESR